MVDVIQADRDAARNWYCRRHPGPVPYDLAQAFARHRLATPPADAENVERLREAFIAGWAGARRIQTCRLDAFEEKADEYVAALAVKPQDDAQGEVG